MNSRSFVNDFRLRRVAVGGHGSFVATRVRIWYYPFSLPSRLQVGGLGMTPEKKNKIY